MCFAVDRDVMESYIDNRNMIDSFPRYCRIVIGRLSVCCLLLQFLLTVKRYSSPEYVISELQGVTCHVGSHSVTFHPTQVNTLSLTPAR